MGTRGGRQEAAAASATELCAGAIARAGAMRARCERYGARHMAVVAEAAAEAQQLLGAVQACLDAAAEGDAIAGRAAWPDAEPSAGAKGAAPVPPSPRRRPRGARVGHVGVGGGVDASPRVASRRTRALSTDTLLAALMHDVASSSAADPEE